MEKEKLTLAELEEQTESLFQQFLFLVWQPNPAKGTVKVLLDNGEVTLRLKNEKFISLIEDTLSDGCSKEVYTNIRGIILSLNEYGCTFFYDRTNNILKRLNRIEGLDKLSMKDIYEAERQKLNKNDQLKESVVKNVEDEIVTHDRKQSEKSRLKDFLHNSLRTFSSWR